MGISTKVFKYGTTYKAVVVSADKNIIAVYTDDTPTREGFLLLGHGIIDLPVKGDIGKIVFERDNRQGHWQWYPGKKFDA